MKNKSALFSISIILAGLLWGSISIFLKALDQAGFSRTEMLFIRTSISSVILFLVFLAKDRTLLKVHFRDLWIFAGSGIFSLTFFSMCYFKTVLDYGASVAVVLLYTSPVFVLLLSALLFREKITALKIISLVLTFAGSVLVAGLLGGGSRLSAAGFFIGIGAGLGYGLYSIFGNIALKKYSSMTITFYTFLFSSVSLLPFVRFTEMPGRFLSGNTMFMALGIALVCTLLPYLFYTKGLSGMEPGRAAILATVEPMAGTMVGFFLFHEEFNPQKIAGILLILFAIIILNLKTKKAPEENSGAEGK